MSPTIVLHWPFTLDGIDFAMLPIPLPATAWVLGARFHAQAAVIDPGGLFVGLSFTRGLRVTVGI